RIAEDVEQLTAELEHASTVTTDALGSAASTLAARVAAANAESWSPTVVVVAPGVVDSDALGGLVNIAGPASSGVVLVAPGPVPTAGWRLIISAGGEALLHPLGLELSCQLDIETIDAS